jgi:hypothetical protein
VAHKFEARIVAQMIHISVGAGIEVVDAQNLSAVFKKTLAQVRAEKARASGNKNPLFDMHALPPAPPEIH